MVWLTLNLRDSSWAIGKLVDVDVEAESMSQGNQKKFESTRMGPRISHETAFSGPGLLSFISPSLYSWLERRG